MNFCNATYAITGLLALALVVGFIALDITGKAIFVLLVAQFFIPVVFGITDPATLQTSFVIATIVGVLAALGMFWIASMHLGCGPVGFIISIILAVGGVTYIAITEMDKAALLCFGVR